MITLGDAVAWGLCAGETGDPESGTGWWGALQSAARISGNDPEMLQIADEIYLFAHALRTPARLFAYVDLAQPLATTPLGQAFLRGMLLHLDSIHDT